MMFDDSDQCSTTKSTIGTHLPVPALSKQEIEQEQARRTAPRPDLDHRSH